MWGFIVSFIFKLFGYVKKADTEKELAQTITRNKELEAENAGLRKRTELDNKKRIKQQEWKDARDNGNTDEMYKILKDDFDPDNSD